MRSAACRRLPGDRWPERPGAPRPSRRCGSSLHQFPQFILVIAHDHPLFGDDGGDVAGRGDVEGWVADSYPIRGQGKSLEMGHLPRVALLDGDIRAAFEGKIK